MGDTEMTSDLIFKLFRILVGLLQSRPKLRLWLTVIFITLFSIASISTIFLYFIISESDYERFRIPSTIATIVFAYFSSIALISYSSLKFDDNFSVKLEELQEERKDLKKRISSKSKSDILDTIQLNLNQLNEYYTINKSQARNSFRFSVFAIVLGLFTLLAGVWFFYLRETPNLTMVALSGISGVLLQFIGGANFYLYRKSLEQLNFFFSQLVKMQDTMLSIKLCEQITKEDRQIDVREKIILSLLERSLFATENFNKIKNETKPKTNSTELTK
jgi:hypothetical protein